jgi:hypothetical protein
VASPWFKIPLAAVLFFWNTSKTSLLAALHFVVVAPRARADSDRNAASVLYLVCVRVAAATDGGEPLTT